MKRVLLKYFLLLTFLSFDVIAFAQTPGTGNGDGDNDDLQGDDVTVPINSKLIWLAIIAVTYAFYTFKKTQKTNTTN